MMKIVFFVIVVIFLLWNGFPCWVWSSDFMLLVCPVTRFCLLCPVITGGLAHSSKTFSHTSHALYIKQKLIMAIIFGIIDTQKMEAKHWLLSLSLSLSNWFLSTNIIWTVDLHFSTYNLLSMAFQWNNAVQTHKCHSKMAKAFCILVWFPFFPCLSFDRVSFYIFELANCWYPKANRPNKCRIYSMENDSVISSVHNFYVVCRDMDGSLYQCHSFNRSLTHSLLQNHIQMKEKVSTIARNWRWQQDKCIKCGQPIW